MCKLGDSDWLAGFAFTDQSEPKAVNVRWSPAELPGLRVLVDGNCKVVAASLPLGPWHEDIERAASRSMGIGFLWNGSWAQWERLSGARDHWLLTLTPTRRASKPAFASLTWRQRQTCELAAQGLTVHQLAEAMGCAPETARSHLKAAYRVLQVSTRVELVEPMLEWETWSALDLPTI